MQCNSSEGKWQMGRQTQLAQVLRSLPAPLLQDTTWCRAAGWPTGRNRWSYSLPCYSISIPLLFQQLQLRPMWRIVPLTTLEELLQRATSNEGDFDLEDCLWGCDESPGWRLPETSKGVQAVSAWCVWCFHDDPEASHKGGEETFRAISKDFVCTGLTIDVRSCRVCALQKLSPNHEPSQIAPPLTQQMLEWSRPRHHGLISAPASWQPTHRRSSSWPWYQVEWKLR